ncbi:MAG: hypothetical protein HRU35_03490 [Rickettsiaceae bacterium]|nr:hypothetical protein [Rickettsiaceae bacterium]
MFNNFEYAVVDYPLYKDIEFYTIEPGDYYLTLIKLTGMEQGYKRSYVLEGLLAKFTANPGEIVYLGNMEFNLKEHNISNKYFWQKGVTVKNEFDEYKEEIADLYPKLKDRIVKRIMILNERATIKNN